MVGGLEKITERSRITFMDKKYAKELLEKVKKDYCQIAENFSATRGRMWEELNVLVGEYVKDGQKILDAGCGNGRLFSILRDKKIDYVGVDSCTGLLDIAREKYKDDKNAKFLEKDLLNLDFKSEKFDIVFAVASFHHVPTEQLRIEVLKGVGRILKPKGLYIMMNWNLFQKDKIKYVKKYNDLVRTGKTELELNDTMIPWKESAKSYDNSGESKDKEVLRYYHAFTEKEISELMEKAGFNIVETYYTKRGERSNVHEGYNLCTVANLK